MKRSIFLVIFAVVACTMTQPPAAPAKAPHGGPGQQTAVVWNGSRYVPADEMPAAKEARSASVASAVAATTLIQATVTGRRADGVAHRAFLTVEATKDGQMLSREVEVTTKLWAAVVTHSTNLCVDAGWFSGASREVFACP